MALSTVVLLTGCDQNKGHGSSRLKRREAVVGPRTSAPATGTTTTMHQPSKTPAKKRERLCSRRVHGRHFPNMKLGHAEARGARPVGERMAVGGTWTWVNLWAAWCGPCKEELPRLLRWRKQLAGKMTVQFVSLDDDERQLLRFLEKQPSHGLRSTFWLPAGKTQKKWLEQVGLTDSPQLPVQVLVDPQGRVHCIIDGAVDEGDFAAVRKLVGGKG